MTLPTYTETSRRAWAQRTTANAIARGRSAASAAACRSSLLDDIRAGACIALVAFIFLATLGVV